MKVFGGLLTATGFVRWEFLTSLGLVRQFVVVEACQEIAQARNIVARRFMATDCDFLWFWDDDLVIPENADELLTVRGDLVAPTVLIKKNQRLSLSAGMWNPEAQEENFLVSHVTDHVPYRVQVAGTGGLLIHRRVLQDSRMVVAENESGEPIWFRNTRNAEGQIVIGHDIDFTRRASELGYRLMVHPQVIFGHHKRAELMGLLQENQEFFRQGIQG